MTTGGDAAAQALYALASALWALDADARGDLNPVRLGEAVDAACRARTAAEGQLRALALVAPDYHDDLARLAAVIRGGAISPEHAARSAGWVSVIGC